MFGKRKEIVHPMRKPTNVFALFKLNDRDPRIPELRRLQDVAVSKGLDKQVEFIEYRIMSIMLSLNPRWEKRALLDDYPD